MDSMIKATQISTSDKVKYGGWFGIEGLQWLESGELNLIHSLFASMVSQPDKKVLNTTLAATIWLHDVNFPKKVFELRVEQAILWAFENLPNELPIFLQQLGCDVESSNQ